MSSSFVPKIEMSKGTAKRNKFDISCNTHTTSEVGYLQPTFSKMLMPKSDLTIKTSDAILLSSLVCPTFGDLSLRHWFMATPVSSLWSCLGAFLTQQSYNDLDSASGHSIPRQMPKSSIWAMIRNLSISAIYKQSIAASPTGRYSVDTVYCPPELMGNLTYAFGKNGDRRSNNLLTFATLLAYLKIDISNNNSEVFPMLGGLKYMVQRTAFNVTPVTYGSSDSSRTDRFLFTNETSASSSSSLRYSSPFPWWWTGIVVKNDASLTRIFTKASSGKTSFPDATECPYVVVFLDGIYSRLYTSVDYDSPANTQDFSGNMSVVPLTNRMFAGDTDPVLYRNGWVNRTEEDDGKLYHPTGNSDGWILQSDDSYFTGDLAEEVFDIVGPQSYAGDSISSSNTAFFYSTRLSRRFKRLRKLFIGLGMQFSPFSTCPVLPFKFMAYYKAWFDNFYPKRDVQYYQTPLARLVQYLSYHSRTNYDFFMSTIVDHQSDYGLEVVMDLLQPFTDYCDILFACADAKYLMPIDYFSLADKNPLEYQNKSDENIITPLGVSSDGSSVTSVASSYGINGSALNGWAVKMADKMLSYLTKKRVVGKSVSDSMRAIFGAVDEHDKAHESTWCFGTSSSPIKISAVMSTAETEEMHLGDYAGRGLGGSDSRTFKIDNNGDLLIVFVMSAVVPRLSYYQGITKENTIGNSPNDFCKPIWDAVGYDDVDVTEYIADSAHKDDLRNTSTVLSARSMADFDGKILGLVPRNTWYKTARDILNGDMSIPSLKASLSPYVLTRTVPVSFGTDPIEMRTVNPDDFNKIFNESSSLDDHFILQIGFNVDMFAPLKSISTSFDDFDANEDGTIEVEHS